MIVRTVKNFADLALYQQRWDELAQGCPFRCWQWLTTWWKHYAADNELHVLLVANESNACEPSRTCADALPLAESVAAILPAYIEVNPTRGRVIRLLGDGEVCSEHLDLLCQEELIAAVVEHLTDFLRVNADNWDAIQITTLAEQDRTLGRLVNELSKADCQVERCPGMNLWTIPLPTTWEEYLAIQSKSHRKQLRQLRSRVLESGRVHWIEVHDHAAFDTAWETLIDLHQRRRQSLGEPGCFASPVWANFHREVALEMLARNDLRLSVLELDCRPVAAEYHFAGHGTTYAYQGGIDPDRVADEPGQLSLMLCIERAIAAGQSRFELLRGDEPYKSHWRARPSATSDLQIVSPRTWARWRHYSWTSLRRAGRIVRQFANLLS